MTDMDQLLARIGDLPLDSRLSGIEQAVLAGLAEARRPVLSGPAFGLIAGCALLVGMAATVGTGGSRPGADFYPLGVSGALAPSSLLGDGHE